MVAQNQGAEKGNGRSFARGGSLPLDRWGQGTVGPGYCGTAGPTQASGLWLEEKRGFVVNRLESTEALPGKSESPARWVEEHGDALYRFALSRAGDPTLAEDLVQETLLAGIKGLAGFQGGATIRTWLIAILRRKIVDHVRRTKREPRNAALEVVDEPGRLDNFTKSGEWKASLRSWNQRGEDVLERKEFLELLRLCLSHLPGKLREAFVLREMEELETPDVCGHLGVSANTLAVRIYRARMSLRNCLENHWLGPTS